MRPNSRAEPAAIHAPQLTSGTRRNPCAPTHERYPAAIQAAPRHERNPTAIQFSIPFGAGPIRSRLTVTTAYSGCFSLIDAMTAG